MMDLILKSFCGRSDNLASCFPAIRTSGRSATQRRWSVWHAVLVSTPPFRSSLFYPLGTMFWARTAALAPLFELGLGWEDYPPEPLPYDGTILHAIERLVTLVARHRGFRSRLPMFPGSDDSRRPMAPPRTAPAACHRPESRT